VFDNNQLNRLADNINKSILVLSSVTRKTFHCSRDIHWAMKYDSGLPNDLAGAGTCQDCGYRTEGVEWKPAPMPKCKQPKEEND
jgi:hypothetical protein